MPIFEGLPPNEKVQERLEQLATHIAELAAAKAEKFLASHSTEAGGVLDAEQIEQVLQREKATAFANYFVEREEGQHNDNISRVVRGLTAVIFEQGKKWVELEFPEDERTLMGPFIEPLGVTAEEREVYMLTLPNGVYSGDERMTMNFYNEGDIFSDYVTNTSGRIAMSKLDVVRIEGDGGELWQSDFWTPTGVQRTPTSMTVFN